MSEVFLFSKEAGHWDEGCHFMSDVMILSRDCNMNSFENTGYHCFSTAGLKCLEIICII